MAQQQPARGDDVELTLALLCLIAFMFCWGLWAYAKQPIVEVIRWVKWSEISVFQMVDPTLASERRMLETLKNDQDAVKAIKEDLAKNKRKPLTVQGWTENGLLAPEVLWHASNRVGAQLRWPVIVLLLDTAIFYMYFSFRNKFKTVHSLESLIKTQAKTWPVITPIVDFNPTLDNSREPGDPVPLALPIFAEALAPEEWISYHRIPIVSNIPEREAVRRALQLQLGPRWTGLAGLTLAQKCLFAAFSLKGAQKRKESDHLLGRISLHWNYKTGFTPSAELMQEVDRINADPKLGQAALRVASNYAYRTTALLGVLKWARDRGGVLAPATFLWLRGHDRDLWYPLNNQGRRTFHAEAAGAMSHYMAEKAAGKALPVPRLETAVLTITQFWGTHTPKLPPVEEEKALVKKG